MYSIEGMAVCPNCGEPMIFTFAFSDSEYYCLICGYNCGMFGEKIVEATKKLKYKKKLYERVFKAITKDLIADGAYYNKCNKCKEMKEPHIEHATKIELLKDEVARELLQNILKEVEHE